MDKLDIYAGLILSHLAWTTLQSALFVAVVALAIRLQPRLSAAARCGLWWLVAVQVVVGFVWYAPISLPLLAPTAAVHANVVNIANMSGMPTPTSYATASAPVAATPITSHWRTLLVTLWILGLLAQLPVVLRQSWRAKTWRNSSLPTTDVALRACCRERAMAMGLRRLPELRISADIVSPQVTGLWRPVILWPAHARLSDAESSMAMAHELAHLRRGDLWLGWLPAIAQRLFFFHPLIALAVREYAITREAACDAQVLRQSAALPHDYGRLLLRLGVVHPAQASLGGASPSFLSLKRRLSMLEDAGRMPGERLRSGILIGVFALVGVLPYRVTAGGVDAPKASASITHSRSTVTEDGRKTASRDVDIYTDERNHDGAYALYLQDDEGSTTTVSGNAADVAFADRLHEAHPDMFWFRRGNGSYLILDKSTVARIGDAYAPMTEFERHYGKTRGKDAELSGEMQGLQAWQASVEEQRRDLLKGDRHAPGADQRLASLDAQDIDIRGRMAGLEAQRKTLLPEQRKQMQSLEDIRTRAGREAAQVIDDALARGMARPV
jgi:beta-lactamase regulating signal transducer with metallopeptidase domain